MSAFPWFPVSVIVWFVFCVNPAFAVTGRLDSMRALGTEATDLSGRLSDISVLSNTDIGANSNLAEKPLDKQEIAAIAQLVFDKLVEQKPDMFPKPETETTDNQVRGILEAQNDTMVAFGTLITCLILISGVFTGFVQYKEREDLKRTREELEHFEDSIRKDSEHFKDEIRADLKQKKTFDNLKKKLDDRTVKVVTNLFAERYSKEIAQHARAIAEETLMMTPQARGALLGQLHGAIGKISEITGKLPSETAAKELYDVLIQTTRNWHVLGQLYSADPDQLQQGLGSFQRNPFSSVRDRLKLLQTRYQDDMEIYPLVADAITALEKQESQGGAV